MITQLTPGERLWVEMQRREWPWGYVMNRWEATEWRLRDWLADARDDVPDVVLAGPLTKVESCRLARRRMGWLTSRAAVELGFDRAEFVEMERGRKDVRPLYTAWAARGWPRVSLLGVVVGL